MGNVKVETGSGAADAVEQLREVFSATVDFVRAAEVAMPEGSRGREKLAHVNAQVQAYAGVVGLGLQAFSVMAPLIETFVARVVKRFNTWGWPATPVDPAAKP